jgi:hypothetical protein
LFLSLLFLLLLVSTFVVVTASLSQVAETITLPGMKEGTRAGTAVKIIYMAHINPGGWAPATVVKYEPWSFVACDLFFFIACNLLGPCPSASILGCCGTWRNKPCGFTKIRPFPNELSLRSTRLYVC